MSKKLLANIFKDGMVLQRDIPIKVWGNAKANVQVMVTFNQDTHETAADPFGRWEITLPALPVSPDYKSHQLTVSAGDDVEEVNDILMGDVWICAGQSNMELPMSRVRQMFADEIKNSNNSHIRGYQLPLTFDFHQVQDVIPEASWIKVTPNQTERFSATGFFFANKLYESLGVPIGLVMTAVGGTPIEAWMSREALFEVDPDQLDEVDQCQQAGYIDQVSRAEQEERGAWYQNLNEFDRGLTEKWYEENFDDENWKEIDLNVSWDEVTGLKACGSIWLRKEVEVPATLLGQPADLILGCIVDGDEVYVNGVRVGQTDYRFPPRDYPVPHLKEGKNTIAIRVIVTNGIGGFILGKEHKLLFADATEIELEKDWRYKRALSCPPLRTMTFFQYKPTGNYNGMIHPLHNFPIKGVIWYQGESNAGNPKNYRKKFSTMLTDWRKNWNVGDFPFIFTQLSNWSPKGQLMNWERLRDEQTKTLMIPNTRMVVTNDVGEYNDLHPLNKKTVGERLAGEALSLVYGMDIVSTGPMLTTIEKIKNQFILNFETFGSVLKLSHGEVVYGLSAWIDEIEIAVEGVIDGTTVVIKTPYAQKVTAISYAWIDDPTDANLYNAEGLPAVQFKKEI